MLHIATSSHKEWRKIAKRERRRKFRVMQAKENEQRVAASADYLKNQEIIEHMLYEQIENNNREENEKWVNAEKIAAEKWHKLKELEAKLHQQYIEKEARLKLEWDLEQKRKKEENERLKAIEEENRKKHQMFIDNLEKFLSGDSDDPPPELLYIHETKPDKELCPFFNKTACCRFGDECSRNHRYPTISTVLLAPNFYTHFGLNNANLNEYDTDILLEYEDSDTYREFKDFFYDILPEFEKFGRVVQIKVCHNLERHLRGNTYVQFAEVRGAVAAYRALHSRWYAARRLSLQFCAIDSWKNALCGLQLRRRCPKGRSCNFLHVFRNPNNLFNRYQNNSYSDRRSLKSPPSSRSWRWSESPEVEIKNKNKSSTKYSDHRRYSREKREEKEDDHKKHRRRELKSRRR